VSFFICQPHLPQNHVDRLQGTLQPRGRSQRLEGQIALASQQSAKLAAVGSHNHGFAARIMMPWGDVAGVPALLEEFFNQAQGHSKPMSNFGTCALFMVVRSQDALPQIE
jgi:hypothetical protein